MLEINTNPKNMFSILQSEKNQKINLVVKYVQADVIIQIKFINHFMILVSVN